MSTLRPIGIFDSGIGGLTVVREMRRALPFEHLVYFGDTARVPYGNKSKTTVTKFSVQNAEFLLKHNVKLIVVACNTASSLSLNFLQRCFKVPLVGVIYPGAKKASRKTRNKRVGIIGTKATVNSSAYTSALRKLDPDIRVYSKACPLFVPLVEEGWHKGKIARQIAATYLNELLSRRIDTLILGCTHYPVLSPLIRKVIGPRIAIVDSARAVAEEAKEVLGNARLLRSSKKSPFIRFYVSDDPERFIRFAKGYLHTDISCSMRSLA